MSQSLALRLAQDVVTLTRVREIVEQHNQRNDCVLTPRVTCSGKKSCAAVAQS